MTILFENQVPFGANVLRIGKTIGRTTTPLAGLNTYHSLLPPSGLPNNFLQHFWRCLKPFGRSAHFQVRTHSVFFIKIEVLLTGAAWSASDDE
jgi:hypothetical protein